MKKKSWLSIFMIGFVVACGKPDSKNNAIQASTPTNTPIMEIAVDTPEPDPQHETTPIPTPIINEDELIPRDSSDALNPTLTPVFEPSSDFFNDLPDWVGDPATNVLFTRTGRFEDVVGTLSLINARTGETYGFAEKDIRGYFWMPDGRQFGLLTRESNQIILVQVELKEVRFLSADDEMLQFVGATSSSDTPVPLRVVANEASDAGFIFLNWWQRPSSDGRFIIANGFFDDSYTEIQDLVSGEIFKITEPGDGLFDYGHSWSPIGGYLGIVHDDEGGCNCLVSETANYWLKIYDLNHRKVIGSFKNVTSANWSPDGTQILYQPQDGRYSNAAPCTYDLLSDETICYSFVANLHATGANTSLNFSHFGWLEKPDRISYIYSMIEHEPYDERYGFCTIQTADSTVDCMLEEFEDEYQKIIRYHPSPDSQYIAFHYDTSCPLCDYSDRPQMGIANLNTGTYNVFGDLIEYSPIGLWRPMLEPDS